MKEKLGLDAIKDFWTRQAAEHQLATSVSWADQPIIDLEVQAIVKHLHDGDRVLDVGCANGYSTTQFALHRQIRIRGLDYIPEMVEQARLRLKDPHLAAQLADRVEFDVGNIMALAEPAATYDKVVVTRVVINLAEWKNQLNALRQCAAVLKPGGLLLLCESTHQGWDRLNKFRQEWGLSSIPMPPHNQFLDENRVMGETPKELEFVSLHDFSSTYFIGTRLLKPLLIQALGADIDGADTTMEWNRWFAQLPAIGDYGKQKLFVFRKRAAAGSGSVSESRAT